MKRWILLTLVLLPFGVTAQDFPPPDGERPPLDEGMPPPRDEGGPGPERFREGVPLPGQMVDRWMERLRKNQPEEFERLQALRQDDPEAFREELSRRVNQERMRALEREHPRVHEAFRNLPPDDRAWLMNRLEQRGGFGGPGGPGGPGSPMNRRPEMDNPEMVKAEEQARELAQNYRSAKDDEQKAKIREDLRSHLASIFDLRQKEREAAIQRVEDRLGQLKESLASRESHKDEILEQRLRQMTEGDTWAW